MAAKTVDVTVVEGACVQTDDGSYTEGSIALPEDEALRLAELGVVELQGQKRGRQTEKRAEKPDE